MNGPVLELRDVELMIGDKQILRAVNLHVNEGERLVVLGESGGGKSTILRIILGMLRATSGSVKFRSRELTRLRRWKLNLIRQRIGMVYQYSALISSLTVRENLALPLVELTRKKQAEIDKAIGEKLEMVGMAGTEDKLPSELSGGMRKRVGLARRAHARAGADPI
jgi:phospholipid/cholesterol/gamma-HCH transport system ATP-binding protein